MHAQKRLAAIVFARGEDPDAPLAAFVAAATGCGARIGGLLQEHGEDGGRDLHDVTVRNLSTGARSRVMQDLGREATGCRVDPGAIAEAAQQLAKALAERPDLIVANRFGRLESEGGGTIAEIGDAVAEGVPLIVCVPARYLDAWNAFADGLDAQLPPTRDAIEAWWRAIQPAEASAP